MALVMNLKSALTDINDADIEIKVGYNSNNFGIPVDVNGPSMIVYTPYKSYIQQGGVQRKRTVCFALLHEFNLPSLYGSGPAHVRFECKDFPNP